MLPNKMIFISGVIIFYLISSTNCQDSEKTVIGTLVYSMKNFLWSVPSYLGLGGYIQLSESYYEEFNEIRTHYFFGNFRIKYEGNWLGLKHHFRHQYKKFVKISIKGIKEYLSQINTIAEYPQSQGRVANKEQRNYFVSWMNSGILKEMTLKGDEDSKVKEEYKELNVELEKLRDRISYMVDPQPVIVIKEDHPDHSSSSSSSESDEHKSKSENGEKKKKKKKKENEENYGDHHGHNDNSASHHHDSSGHGGAALATGVVVGAVAGTIGGIALAEAMHDSESGQVVQETPVVNTEPVVYTPPPPPSQPSVEQEASVSSSQYDESENGNVNMDEEWP